MNAIIIGDARMVHGLQKPKPLRGFPPGKARLRIRHDGFARAFIRSQSGIRGFYIRESRCGKFWEPDLQLGGNIGVGNVDTKPELTKSYFSLVVQTVAFSFGVTSDGLVGESRKKRLTEARFAAWLILREQGFTLRYISIGFDRNDIGTIRHGVMRARRMIRESATYGVLVEDAMRRLSIGKTAGEL